MGGEYSRGSGACKAISGRFPPKFISTSSRGRVLDGAKPRRTPARRAPRRRASPPAGSRKLSVPTATSVAPAARNSAASAPLPIPPMPTIGSSTAAATARSCCSATGRTAGPERPPWPAARAGLAGERDRPRSPSAVLISETASAPPSSAATATAAGSATLGVSFTISGFSVSGRSASSSATVSLGCSPTIRPEWTLGQETLSSIAATSSRSATAATSRANSSRLVAITETISGTGSSASCGRSSARKPSRPLFGSPIELIIPAGVSQIRRGSLPARGSGVIVFETKAEKGKSSSRASPKTRAGGDRVEGAGGVDHRVGELDAAEAQAWATSATWSPRTTGPSTQRRM